MKQKIYFDHNSTTPVLPEVVKAMEPFWAELYANPSSIHEAGTRVAREIRKAREEVALFLGAQDETEIIFTSGGTESNNTAFRSALWTEKGKRRIVTTSVEHSSVLKLAKALEEEGAGVFYVPVNQKGELDLEKWRAAVASETLLASVMMANNETGILFPIEEIGRELREKEILFHVDGVQAAGKIPISLKDSCLDFFSLSGHKLGAPKGIGVLYVRKGIPFRSYCFGGAQERGRRAGTENVPGMIGLGVACKLHREKFIPMNQHLRQLRNHFEQEVLRRVPKVEINGDPQNRLPNTSHLAFEGIDSETLLILLDQEGIYASSGSACLSGAHEPSHVLKAMGFSKERARSSIRFSFGIQNTIEEVEAAAAILGHLVSRLRQIELEDQHPH